MEPKIEEIEPMSVLDNFWNVKLENYYNQLPIVDRSEARDPQAVAEYAEEIYEFLKREESGPEYGYMKSQKDINEKMRAILIDWLIEVHLKFKLLPETLFLTVNLIDRYLMTTSVERQKLQLVGVTAMLIASKYEEIYAPEVRDFVYITDQAYSKQDVLAMELKMLQALDFGITTVSSYRFLERYAKLVKLSSFAFNLSRYLIEMALIEYRMLKYSPSNLASSAIYLTLKIMRKEKPWPQIIEKAAKFEEKEVRPCAKDMCTLL